MEAYLTDWAGLLLRWAHVVTAIAWIGSSFYFVFLDSSLTPPTDPESLAKGVDGELWAVHGGGFYHPQKYRVAPRTLPARLHWFYWESYSTWLTGFGLFVVLYLLNAGTLLVDRTVLDWSAGAASAAALGFLAGGWLVYDAICRLFGQRRHGELVVGGALLALVVFASWLACALFAGRAAFVLVGAMLATAMSANVLFCIIPAQRRLVAQLGAGLPVDPIHGARARQRSVHNTYFTLPVVIAMLTSHSGWLYGGPHNWLVLVLLMASGALIRHFFVARHRAAVQGSPPPWGHAAAGVGVLLALMVWRAPPPAPPVGDAGGSPRFAEVKAVVDRRCVPCHNAQLASKNVMLHTPELLRQHALALVQQAVVLRQMPLNNATGISDGERALLRRWYEAGAAID